MSELLDFYQQAGSFTRLPDDFQTSLLPEDLPALVQLVQNLLVHIFWADKLGLRLSEIRKKEVNLRSCQEKLQRLMEIAEIPLDQPRPLDKKLVGNCRDFSLMLTALLKAKGIPARARCGFSAYFSPGLYEDHWVTEYWNKSENRWCMVDAQLDEMQKQALKIRFNPLDVPSYQFINSGKAWLLCRTGQADPNTFGIFEMHGLWFVRGDLVRDFLALNSLEILPWDVWGIIVKHDNQVTKADFELLDRMAGLCLDADEGFSEIRSLYQSNAELRIPLHWQA